MVKKLKVIGGNLDGTHRAILRCTSVSKFMEMTGISRSFCTETHNPEELEVARTDTVLIRTTRSLLRGEFNNWTEYKRV